MRQEPNQPWRNVLAENGYFGAVDPKPYMEDIFALNYVSLYKKFKELSARVAELVALKLRK